MSNTYTDYGYSAADPDRYVQLSVGIDDEIDTEPESFSPNDADSRLSPRERRTAGVLISETASISPLPGNDAEFLDALAQTAAVIPRVAKAQVASPVYPAKGKSGWNLDDPRVAARWDLVQRAVRMSRALPSLDLYHFVFALSEDGLRPTKSLNANLADWVWALEEHIALAFGPFQNQKQAGGDVPTTKRMYVFFYNKK